jgi:transcriptional regulator with XRE-family HTH domain
MTASIGERLVTERERLGLSQTAFAVQAGVGVRLQVQYEAGRVPPMGYLLALNEMGADLLFVLTGRRSNSVAGLTDRELFLLEAFRACSERERQHVLDTVALLSK